MKFYKKIISFLVVTALICSSILSTTVFAIVGENETKSLTPLPIPTFNESKIMLKFGVMSDIHLYNQQPVNRDRVEKSINFFKEQAGGEDKLDAVTISGDITDWGGSVNMPEFKTLLDKTLSTKNTEMIIATGNHDVYEDAGNHVEYNMYEKYIGDWTYHNPIPTNTEAEILRSNYHTVINGIHFITVYGIDGDHAKGDLNWLDAQLKIATQDTPDKPVFVFTHVAPANTIYGTFSTGESERWFSNTLTPVLAKYPQAVSITGHSHNTTVPETTIWQDSFTAINAGPIKGNLPQIAFAEIDESGNVRYTRYFLNDGSTSPTKIQDTWVFKPMKSSADAVYSIDNRLKAKNKPYFEENRNKLEITQNIIFNTTNVSAKVDTAKDEDMVMAYRMVIRDKATQTILGDSSVTTSFENYYDPSEQMPIGKVNISCEATGLKSETDYEICVYALDSFGGHSDPLIKEFRTDKFSDIPTDDFSFRPIMDFDFLETDKLFGNDASDTSSALPYNVDYNKKIELSATKTGALSGNALKIKSIKGLGSSQEIKLNPLCNDNPYKITNADTPAFISFYFDGEKYSTPTGSMTVKFTEKDANGSFVTYGLKQNSPFMTIDKNGCKTSHIASDKGEFAFAKNFKGYIMLPLNSFAVEKGTDSNNKIDGVEIKEISFNLKNSGYKNAELLIDEVGFAVKKGSEGSKDYIEVYTKEPDCLIGDADGNGQISTLDALAVLKHIAKIEIITKENNLKAADYDLDTYITTIDVIGILKKLASIG